MRKVFISLLEKSYHKQIEKGFVDARASFLVIDIASTLQMSKDAVAEGKPITAECLVNVKETVMERGFRASAMMKAGDKSTSIAPEYKKARRHVERALATISAHMDAQAAFKAEFCDAGTMPSFVEATVLKESDAVIAVAKRYIDTFNPADVQSILTHFLCLVLLNKMMQQVGSYMDRGLLNSTEAEHFIHPLEVYLENLNRWNGDETDINRRNWQKKRSSSMEDTGRLR